jgi:hypothetical protein
VEGQPDSRAVPGDEAGVQPAATAQQHQRCAGVYLRRQIVRRGDWTGECVHWQAQTPQGIKPFRSRSFSIDRYGFDGAYNMAVKARAEFVAEVEWYIGVTPIPERFRPAVYAAAVSMA